MTPTNRESQPDADDRPQPVQAQGLTMAYGRRIIQHDLTFTIRRGETFVIMGGSGCGKSTLLRHLIGLALSLKTRTLLFITM